MRGTLKVCAVKAPAFGDRRKEILGDIATLTGGTLISEELGMKLETVKLNQLGTAEKVNIDKDTTTIINGGGKVEDIAERVETIKTQIEKTTSDYEREQMQSRLSKLSGGVAIIYIGATTETELKEKKDRVDDALHATRAAVAEGIVPGGGTALLRVQSVLDKVKVEVSDDYHTGILIVRKACEAPLRTIIQNGGGQAEVIINAVANGEGNYGYDARTETFGDLVESGIIDPTKVTRLALQNAASIAGLLLTTECVVGKTKEKETQPQGMGGMMGM
jgi:chaperonin GroEL